MANADSTHDSAAKQAGLTVPWEFAMSAAERIQNVAAPSRTDLERGKRRFDGWRRMVPFRGGPQEVEARLSSLEVSATELTALLGESPESLRSRRGGEPPWSRAFSAAWEKHQAGAGGGPDHAAWQDGVPENLGFLEMSRPLLADARARLLTDLLELAEPIAAIPELAALPTILADSLPLTQLTISAQRMAASEVNAARVEGRLAGASPEERFESFLRLLRDPDYGLALWRKYPVLARYQVEVLDAWRATRVEFARNLLADFSSLVDVVLEGSRPGPLTGVDFGAGDTHRGGRSVAIVRFVERQVVYKPRALHGDVAFNQCLEWFNGQCPPHRLRVPRVLTRPDHGWVEFVERGTCAGEAELTAFYWRLGVLLALLHGLNATDMHLENVIAAGDCPVAIDLEALFDTRPDVPRDLGSADPAAAALLSSVLIVGLLPSTQTILDEQEQDKLHKVDLSAAASAESMQTWVPVAVIEDESTDTMRIVRKHATMEVAGDNRPRLAEGTVLDPLAYGDQMEAGYTFAYHRICQDRVEFLRPGGLIDAFGQVSLRAILRPTQTYARLLEESTHPDFLGDELDRDRSLARLCQGLDDLPHRYRLMAAEIQALRGGDIPAFTIRPEARDVWLDTGDLVADVLPVAPIEVVRDRLQRMGEDDLAFQLRLIRDSYAGARMSNQEQEHPPVMWPIPPQGVPAGELIEHAEKIGQRLLDLAVIDNDRIGWLGLTMVDEHNWRVMPAGTALYQGLPGIGLLLTYLAAETGRAVWVDHARMAARTAAAQMAFSLDNLEKYRSEIFAGDRTGFFGDLAGQVTFLLHAGQVFGDGEMFSQVRRALPLLEQLVPHDTNHDLILGNGGLLLAMLAVHEVLPDAGALRIAQACAEHLLTHNNETEEPHAWYKSGVWKEPLAGLSHGVAGNALALARLHRLTGEQRLVTAIESGLRYENTLYDTELDNWRDLRAWKSKVAMRSWCHGAPGIGLARYEMLSCGLPEPVHSMVAADLETALRSTWRVAVSPAGDIPVYNHSICHGDLGNVELLTTVPDAGGPDRGWQAPVRPEQVLAAIVGDARDRGWRCGVPTGVETVGLMPGLAGIGYQLLHLARPDRVPSILRMQAPLLSKPDAPSTAVAAHREG